MRAEERVSRGRGTEWEGSFGFRVGLGFVFTYVS